MSAWPQFIAWPYSRPCVGVLVLRTARMDPNNRGVPLPGVSTSATLPSWEMASQNGKPVVRINNVGGLDAGTYQISFVCLAG